MDENHLAKVEVNNVEPLKPFSKAGQPPTPIKYSGGMVQIQTLEDAWRFAQYAVKSNLVPSGLKTPEAVLIAMQYGAEVGLKPMQSLQNICVINGKPALYAKGIPGVVQASGLLESWLEWHEGQGDDLTAFCKAKRRGGMERTESFSMADAKKAKLDKKPGPWQDYTKMMLQYRARSHCFGTLFADCLCGFKTVEELNDYPQRRPDSIQEHVNDPVLATIEPLEEGR